MLIAAAAARWKVDHAACSAANGTVVHSVSKRSLKYGALVADASKLALPADPPLKKAGDFRLIGKPTKCIDGRDIVTGAARYGIDTKIPKMLYASIERPPWPGANPKNSQEASALAIRGVAESAQVGREHERVDQTHGEAASGDRGQPAGEPGPCRGHLHGWHHS